MSTEDLIRQLAKTAGIIVGRDIVVNDRRFYDRILQQGSLGLGESYIEGWWEAREITLDELAYRVQRTGLRKELEKLSWRLKLRLGAAWLYRWFCPIKSIDQAKVVALQHYDLGNKFFEKMLGGPSGEGPLVYSCGYFTGSHRDLQKAQIDKMELINQKLKLKSALRVLDIGSGWGVLANYLASKNPGLEVDGVTISKEQFYYAQKKYGSTRVKFHLTDYRLFKPSYKYDAIVSVGMFEHVNPENYREFMEYVRNLLNPGGLFLLHTIGRNDSGIIGDPWMTKYIFPNSTLPSLTQISEAAENLFVIEDVQNFGSDYDKTLLCWRQNFINANFSSEEQPSPEFMRMWDYYLSMCAGTFRARKCQLYQVVLSVDREGVYRRPAL